MKSSGVISEFIGFSLKDGRNGNVFRRGMMHFQGIELKWTVLVWLVLNVYEDAKEE